MKQDQKASISRLQMSINMYQEEIKRMEKMIPKAKEQGFGELYRHYVETKLLAQGRIEAYNESIEEIKNMDLGEGVQ